MCKIVLDKGLYGYIQQIFLFIILGVFISVSISKVFHSPTFVYDEGYYIPAAQKYLYGDLFANTEHPPLGKLLMSFGIFVLGNNPLGWRLMSLMFGVIGIYFLYFLAMKMFRDHKTAIFAAFLLAFDIIWSTFSSLAMLDIFVSVLLIAVSFMLWLYIEKPSAGRSVTLGAVLGLAVAVKWVAVFFLVAIVFLIYLTKRLDHEKKYLVKHALLFNLSFVCSYFLPYIFFWGSVDFTKIIVLQIYALKIHTNTSGVVDPNSVPPWSWFWTERFIDLKHISLNLLIYSIWPFIFFYKLYKIIRTSDYKVYFRTVFILVCFSSLYFPWFLVERPTYTFYLLPTAPFICLTIAILLRDVWIKTKVGKGAVVVYLISYLLLYLYNMVISIAV